MKLDKKILTRVLLRLSKDKWITLDTNPKQDTLFVMGMFRSGTSLTCEILKENSFSLSAHWRLLKGKGRLKKLNPNGFFEDFLFANIARYWIHTLGKSGENPPTQEEIKKITFHKIPLRDLILFAEFTAPDDRISYLNRHRAYLLLLLKRQKAFYFKNQTAIKIPMLLLFHEQLSKWLPNAQFLIVIRNPDSTIKSSKLLTNLSSINLYNHYYEFLNQLYQNNKAKTKVFSYDNLLTNPRLSIERLTRAFNLPYNEESINLIDSDLIRSKNQGGNKSDYYNNLYKQIINKL